MTSLDLFVVSALGLAMGVRHAADADHVVAVAAIVARRAHSGGAWLVGVLWGLGHSLTLLAVGAAIILLKVTIPERVALSFEFLVGAVLVLLGLANLSGARALFGEGVHAHEHAEGHHEPAHEGPEPGHAHPHVHFEETPRLVELARQLGPAQSLRSFTLGLLHGLAGSAAVALLILATIPGPLLSVVYLLVFGLGTLIGMTAMTALMQASLAALGSRARLERWIGPATGLCSFLFGSYMMVRIGFIEGLFR